jgi:hypothetical protein
MIHGDPRISDGDTITIRGEQCVVGPATIASISYEGERTSISSPTPRVAAQKWSIVSPTKGVVATATVPVGRRSNPNYFVPDEIEFLPA